MSDTLINRLMAKVEVSPDGCWLFKGSRQPTGYGAIWDGHKPERAHRASYRAFVGPIPDGKEIDHICDVRSCVNPAHLRAVTHKENMARSDTEMGRNARKTHCKRGHPLSGENLSITPSGSRQCRTCMRLHAANARKRKRNAESVL